jgi:cytochrome c553
MRLTILGLMPSLLMSSIHVQTVQAQTGQPQAEPVQTVQERFPTCLACHGAAGTSGSDGVPSLGGQPSDYVLIQLYLFREKQRPVEIMNAMAQGLTDEDLRDLADRVAGLAPPQAAAQALDAADQEHARDLVAKYRCASCHNQDFSGHDQIPRLAAQREEYLNKSLTEYKANIRAGYDPAMNEVAQEIKQDDIPALARYLATFR